MIAIRSALSLAIVAVFLLSAWAVETLFDHYRPATGKLVRLLAILLVAFAVCGLCWLAVEPGGV